MQRRLTHVGTIDSMNGKHSFRCCVESKPHSFTGPVESIGEQPWLLWTLLDEFTDSVTHSTSYWKKHGILFANFVSFMERNPRCAHWILTDWKAQTGTWLHKHIESSLAPAGFKTPGCANADDVGSFNHRGAAISKNSSLCLTFFFDYQSLSFVRWYFEIKSIKYGSCVAQKFGFLFSKTVVILKKQILNYKFVVFCLQHFLTCLYFRLNNGLIPQKFLKIKK